MWLGSNSWNAHLRVHSLAHAHLTGINGMRFFEFGKEMGRKFSFLFGWEGKGKEKFVFLVWEEKGRKRKGKKLYFGSGGKWEG